MTHYAVTAVGRDRPGIVAGLTAALRDVGGNLEDVSSTILRGHFAMMLVVDVPDAVGSARLRERLVAAAEPLGVQVTVSDAEAGTAERPSATHVLTVYGADHPGIVAAFATQLAERGVNITDLSCRLTDAEQPLYVMVAELAVPDRDDPDRLATELAAVAADVGVDFSFAAIEAETL